MANKIEDDVFKITEQLLEGSELVALARRNSVQIDRVVNGCLEFVRLEVQGIHNLLGIAHSQL